MGGRADGCERHEHVGCRTIELGVDLRKRTLDGRLVRDAKVLVGFGMPLLAAQPNVLTPVVELVDQLATGPDGERVQRRKPTAATLFQIDVSVEGQDPVRAFCDRVAPVIESILTIVGKAPSGPF